MENKSFKVVLCQLGLLFILVVAIGSNWYLVAKTKDLVWSMISIVFFAIILKFISTQITDELKKNDPNLQQDRKRTIKEAREIIFNSRRHKFLFGKNSQPIDSYDQVDGDDFTTDPVFWLIAIFLFFCPYLSSYYISASETKDLPMFSFLTLIQLVCLAVLVRNICRYISK